MHLLNCEEYLFVLAHCPFLSHREKWHCLIQDFPEFENYTQLNGRNYRLSHEKKDKYRQYLYAFNRDAVKENYRKAKLHTVSLASLDYPYALKNSYEPPMLLFYKGDYSLIKHTLIGMVGARECTHYGLSVINHLVPPLVSRDIVTVSGLAKGIDTTVHTKTIRYGGKTIAVIGNGIGYTYPRENKALQTEIGEQHLLLSEYPLNEPPKKHYFPMRNRIIAGLSRGIVVIEAKERSGSLITARMALEEGRDVFAVPGSVFSEQSIGCHDLIKLGAIPCQNAGDVLSEWQL